MLSAYDLNILGANPDQSQALGHKTILWTNR